MDTDLQRGSSASESNKPAGALPLLLLCMAQFMLILDISIVNVGLPSIKTSLNISSENLQLVVTLYALTFGGLLLLGGRLADILGRRRVFVAGVFVFTFASLICGFAQSDTLLFAARAVQGIGGALVSPAALSLLISLFPEGKERDQALGVWSLVAAIGGAAGLLLGGILITIADWRWMFLLNVPIGAMVAVASLRFLPAGQPNRKGHIDVFGAVAITASLMALVYGLGRGGQQGFGEGVTVAVLAASAVLLLVFVVIELRVREPLLPFSLFRSRTLTGANIATLLFSAVIIGSGYFLTLYFQQVLGYSPLQTAFAFLPQTIVAAVVSLVAARFVNRIGLRPLFVGAMLALALGAALLSGIAPNASYFIAVLPGLMLVSIGLGIGFTVGTLAATAGVDAEQQGVASGVLNTSQQIGGAIGLAVLAAIAVQVTNGSAEPQMQTAGYSAAFLVASGFAVAAGLVVAALVRSQTNPAVM